jgi:hypothetical protein
MRKAILTPLLLTTIVFGSYAGIFTLTKAYPSGFSRLRLGIKFTPCLSYAKVIDKNSSDGINYKQNGSTVRMIIGPFLEYAINPNVAFATGLWYSPRSVFLTANNGHSQYNLQYLMIPIYFKFYTNEIAQGTRLYCSLGGTIDIKIAEKKVGTDEVGLKDPIAENAGRHLFNFIDASILMAAGVEFNIKNVTNVFVGISYNRGMTNIINPFLEYTDASGHKTKPYQNLAIKNNLLSLDLGVKF